MAKLLSNTRVYGTATVDTQLFVNGNLSAHSAASGSLQVSGGIGVSGGGFFGGSVTATNFVGNVSGTANLATDLAGGTAGQLVYQIGPNNSGFAGPGTAGQILRSNGTSAPSYVNTTTFLIGIAKNLLGGSAGQFAYQTAAHTTNFISTGSMYVGRAVIADSLLNNAVSTATNLTGGTAGQVPYQSAPGITNFFGPGTAGQILTSNGAASPIYRNTSTIYVNSSVFAEDIRGGTAGQLVYQSAANTTAFAGPGTAGQVLTSGGTGAPVYINTSSLYVGRAVLADSATAGTSNQLVIGASTTNAAHYLAFVDSNNSPAAAETFYTNSAFVVNPSTGHVGINIASPGNRLHIYSSVGSLDVPDLIKLETYRGDFTGIGGGALVFKNQDSNNATNEARIKVVTENDGSIGLNNEGSSSFIFNMTNGGTAADRVIFRGDGLVGIGTNNPQRLLHIAGTTADTRFRISANDGTNYRGLEITAGTTFKGGMFYRTTEGNVMQIWGPNSSLGAIYIDANNVVDFNSNATVHSTATGAVQIIGGLGVGGGGFFGGIVTATNFVGTFNGTVDNSILFNGVSQATYTASLRANNNISGGGTITYDSSGNLLWSQRFIVISNGRGSFFATSGYYDINCPTSGTITGVGGSTDKTATAAGIPIGSWEALYYILPIGSAQTSLPANFRVARYTANLEIPHNWVLIAIRNGDNGMLYVSNGTRLPLGTSIATGTYDARRAVTTDTLSTQQRTTNAAHYLIFVDSNNVAATPETVYTTSSFVINPGTGNVGIGTTSPATLLSVAGDTTLGANTTNIVTVNGYAVTESVLYTSNQNSPYLIAGSTSYTGAATNWGTYGFQHRFKSTSGGVPRITVDALVSGVATELYSISSTEAVFNVNVGIAAAAPAYPLDITGTARATSDFRAPIFYDTNNTAYYTDPASTSVINNMNFAGIINSNSSSTRTKYRVYGSGSYAIGMQSGITFGGLNDWAMTFQFNNDNDRGFWWGDDAHTVGQGAMALNTRGWLTVAERIKVGGGQSDTADPSGDALQVVGTGSATVDFRAPIFYDTNNTAFFADPASTSRLNVVTLDGISCQDTRAVATTPQTYNSIVRWDFKTNTTNGLSDGGSYNGVMYWRKYGSGADWSGGGAVELGYTDNARMWMRYGSSTTWGSWKRFIFGDNFDNGGAISTSGTMNLLAGGSSQYYTSAGSLRGYIQATETDDSHFIIATSGGEDISFKDGGLSGSVNMVIRGNATVEAYGDFRAPIFYDSNNTAYYTDPAGLSNLNRIQLEGSGGGAAPSIYTNDTYVDVKYGSSGAGGIRLYDNDSALQGYWYASGGGEHGFLDNDGNWAVRIRTGTNAMLFYTDNNNEFQIATTYTLSPGSSRAPIFYDSNNTAFYTNPASTSILNSAQIASLGVGTAASGTAGEIRATNEITAYYSDSRLKTVKGVIKNALNKLKQLTGYYYTSNDEAGKYGYDTEKMQVGVLAQDVEKVLPEIVTRAPFDIEVDENGKEKSRSGNDYKTVRYEKLIPLLIEAIKEQNEKIEQLEQRIDRKLQ